MEDLQQSLLPLLISSQTHHIGFAKLKSRNPRNPTQSTGGGGINGVNREQDLERSVLGDQELLLLALWDKLRDLGVKLEVVKAEASAESGEGGGEGQRIGGLSEKELQQQLIEATANLKLKEMMIEATLAGDPVLGAIYPKEDASGRQRSLLPLLSRRDLLSSTHAHLSSLLLHRQTSLTSLQTSTISLSLRNKELAAQILELSQQREKEKEIHKTGEYKKAEEAYKAAKRKWDVTSGVTRAIVVESGVDWARDEGLRVVVVGGMIR
ncbi:Protein of unknown function [Pyronema omphalodes CBS 100304]|uniref:Centromere protein H C-terminal domain-containing protein n=1 Tax=Pyronema omphalodes (strain CBS 100304) TaxID=1076935 RepID=U4LJT9_PYROM|nr:Protein of unknown function [Pyronema omphalodes CBS 100304]